MMKIAIKWSRVSIMTEIKVGDVWEDVNDGDTYKVLGVSDSYIFYKGDEYGSEGMVSYDAFLRNINLIERDGEKVGGEGQWDILGRLKIIELRLDALEAIND